MSGFDFERIHPLTDDNIINKGFFLWVWHADKIPPHVGCSIEGKYFSLKVNGIDQNLDTNKVLSVINQKEIPSILIKINQKLSFDLVKTIFQDFTKAESGKTTCLTPIIQLLAENESITQLSELLKYLQEHNNLESVFGLNLTNGYKGIRPYNSDDIENRLRLLENAKSKKYISKVG